MSKYFTAITFLLFFQINALPQPYIIVTSPNGGEAWCDGNITWEDNIPGNVEIQLFKAGVFHSSITTSTPSDGSYTWNIPGASGNSDYLIRIVSADDSNIFDFSDSTFTIGCDINIISPNGGEIWLAGTSHTITWESNVGGDVIIELYKGRLFHSIITGPTPNDGFHNWEISYTLVLGGSDYRVKIISIDNPSIFDISNSDFTIVGNNITVISPNGREEWYAGTTETIIWTAAFPVEIQLFKGGIFHSIIEPLNGQADWSIPYDIASGLDYKVKIVSVTGDNVFDFSDEFFTITNTTRTEEIFSGIPDTYQLMQNYPNPFNPSTSIYYALPEEGSVELVIYDVLGNEILKYNEEKVAGYHKLDFDASNYNSGVYFYRLRATDSSSGLEQVFTETKKMILLK
ncbi:MAG: T9SS type A sorting domain-containing protein [Ignavibacteria bacterium]|nr:T9SS type A sorting domain-containing protein [Ignavibacteria bacterium]